MVTAITLHGILTFTAWWFLVSTIFAVALGRWLRDTDRAARQLHEEERRRREKLQELNTRRRRRTPR